MGVGAGEHLVDRRTGRGIVDAQCDRVPGPLREQGSEVHAVLPDRPARRRRATPPLSSEGDHPDRPDAEPERVEPDQQDPNEPERERHARTLDHGLGADPLAAVGAPGRSR